jgi:hypothetical protein
MHENRDRHVAQFQVDNPTKREAIRTRQDARSRNNQSLSAARFDSPKKVLIGLSCQKNVK